MSEPTNVTILEGESTRINCTTTMPDSIATWILNGRLYYWSDFMNDDHLDVYTLDLVDNSLTINNAPRTLDNTSFQCVVNNHLSMTGYLTVLYMVLPTSTVPITRSTSTTCTLAQSSMG